jgi:hypothetical protein
VPAGTPVFAVLGNAPGTGGLVVGVGFVVVVGFLVVGVGFLVVGVGFLVVGVVGDEDNVTSTQ